LSNDNNEIIEVDEIKLTEGCRAMRCPALKGEDLILYTSATGGQMYLSKKDISLMYHRWVEEEEINSVIDFDRHLEIEVVGTSYAAHNFELSLDKKAMTYITGFKLDVDGGGVARLNIDVIPKGFRDTIKGKITRVKVINNPQKSEEKE
jgi:hypothetical protein